MMIHGYGDLTINSRIAANPSSALDYNMGIIKTGSGNLTIGMVQGYRSSTAVYGGTLTMVAATSRSRCRSTRWASASRTSTSA